MIKTFGNEKTRSIYRGYAVDGVSWRMQQRTLARLQLLNAAVELQDLVAARGTTLQALDERRRGFHCIRVDAGGRICFQWHNGDSYEVEFFAGH